jgi:hypothetical protein
MTTSWIPILCMTAALGTGAEGASPGALAEIKRIARKAEDRSKTPWVREFMRAAQQLPPVGTRSFLHTPDKKSYFTPDEAARLPEAQRAKLVRRDVDEEVYYARIVDPLGYLRVMEVLAGIGFEPKSKRIVDFGYGNIGQLKMLAAVGASTVGIEVDALLPKLYEKEATPSGSGGVRVLHGYFPTDRKVVDAVGRGYDLFLSKNTLKRGYVHPAIPVEPSQRIDLGSDDKVLGAIHDLLKPGGLFVIYNFGPAPAAKGKPYVQMADIRCPFDRRALERAGFEVLSLDVDDNAEGRAVARLLEWDRGPDGMDVDRGLFASYTIARRRAD